MMGLRRFIRQNLNLLRLLRSVRNKVCASLRKRGIGLCEIYKNLCIWFSEVYEKGRIGFCERFGLELDPVIAKFPRVLSFKKTLAKLRDGKSIARYGDGEFNILARGGDLAFQKSDDALARRLREILIEGGTRNCLIAIDGLRLMKPTDKHYSYTRDHYRTDNLLDDLVPYFNRRARYANSYISRPIAFSYVSIKDYRRIWKNRDVVFIVPSKGRFYMDPRFFDNIKSARFIDIPARDAFSKYDEILARAKEFPRGVLFFISAGPTATVLAYDLSKLGYHALDLGHLTASYKEYTGEGPQPEFLPIEKDK